MAQLTALDPDDVAAIAAAYGTEITHVTPLWAGTINSNFRIDSPRGALFLRVNEGKSNDDVAYEAELVAHLAERGVPTPRPLPAVGGGGGCGGRPFAAVRGKLVTLFPWVTGGHVHPPDMGEARLLGDALARMHAAGASFPRRRESRYSRPAIRARAGDIRGAPPVIAALLEEIREPLAIDADPQLPRGVIHGDLFPDNVLFDKDQLALLDFEQASDGELVYDLAVCLLSWCWDGSDLVRPLARAMVSGYAALRPLTPVEVAAFPEMCRFAALRFTVTRVTDIELAPRVTPELRAVKDYRDFERRWRRLVALGDDAVRSLVS